MLVSRAAGIKRNKGQVLRTCLGHLTAVIITNNLALYPGPSIQQSLHSLRPLCTEVATSDGHRARPRAGTSSQSGTGFLLLLCCARPSPLWTATPCANCDTSLSTEQSVLCSRPQESSELSKYGCVCFLLHFQGIVNIWGKKMSTSYGLAATGD